MNNFARIVMRNSAFGMAAQMVIKVLSFGFSVLIVRNLGAEAFGQYAAVGAFGSLFIFIADLGLSPYAVREVARLRDQPGGLEKIEALFGNITVLRLLLSVIAGALMLFSAWLTGRPLVMIGAIALNVVSLLLYAIEGSSEAILSGFERLDITSSAKVLNQLGFVILGAVLLLAGLGYYGLILANLAAVALMTWLCWTGIKMLKVRLAKIDRASWLNLLRLSLPFGIVGFALGLSYKFDSVLLNIFRSDAETGYYNAAYNLVFSAALLSNVINTALYPSLTRRASSSSVELHQTYARAWRYLLVFAFPIAVGGSVLAGQIVPFLFKDGYLPAIPALQIIIWTVPLIYTSEFLGYVVVINNQERKVAQAVLFSTGFNVLVNLLMVPRFGFVAAAITTVVTEAVLVSQYLWHLRDFIKKMNLQQNVLKPFVAAVLMGCVSLILQAYVPLLVNVAVSGAIYLGLLIALNVIGRDELGFLRELRSNKTTETTS